MKKGNKILIGGIALGVLMTGFMSNYHISPLDDVKASSSHEMTSSQQSVKVFTNSDSDKTQLLNMMINSTDYFKNASGSFRYYSKNAETDMDIDFVVDIENSKSYEKNTFRNLKTKSIVEPFEESIFNGEYYSVYRSQDYLATQLSLEELATSSGSSQFHYQKISTPDSQNQGIVADNTIEDRIATTDAQDSYVRKTETSLMGITKTVLLPEDFAIGFIGTDLSGWNIVSNEKYLDRDCVIVEPVLNAYYKGKHNAVSARFIIDSATGILLESHLIDSDGNDTFLTKINSLSLNQSLQTNVFDKHNHFIKENE
ncbi:hypothetical protein [Candidatus Stoquefichus sp. SB1]|uniref:hypothetical protein n=1 Tax=Candidatus Stoquefichus sp. SB1 TaxID=1658109 RepID=UPI00067F43CA|nr:hypothetical protein [Candidatus Stoquefichus sp. SB1]